MTIEPGTPWQGDWMRREGDVSKALLYAIIVLLRRIHSLEQISRGYGTIRS